MSVVRLILSSLYASIRRPVIIFNKTNENEEVLFDPFTGIFAVSVFAQPVMKISASEHDFENQEEAGKQKFDFVVMEQGDQPLVIKNIVASCMHYA